MFLDEQFREGEQKGRRGGTKSAAQTPSAQDSPVCAGARWFTAEQQPSPASDGKNSPRLPKAEEQQSRSVRHQLAVNTLRRFALRFGHVSELICREKQTAARGVPERWNAAVFTAPGSDVSKHIFHTRPFETFVTLRLLRLRFSAFST